MEAGAEALASKGVPVSPGDKTRIAELTREIEIKEKYLRSANEELEASNEELKSANEEMQSINEELHSTNEELETSKEELQSVNEELATVNAEMQSKISDLSQANNDMNNLLAGSSVATVFVDHQLRIKRFTPPTVKIINLIAGDVGRPITHVVTNLKDYDRMAHNIKEVLENLVPQEQQVQTLDGKWYVMRIQPYRTIENVIEGAVITFNDITNIKKTEEALAFSEASYHRLFQVTRECIMIVDPEDGRIIDANTCLLNLMEQRPDQVIGRLVWEVASLRTIATGREQFLDLEKQALAHGGSVQMVAKSDGQSDTEFDIYLFKAGSRMIMHVYLRSLSQALVQVKDGIQA